MKIKKENKIKLFEDLWAIAEFGLLSTTQIDEIVLRIKDTWREYSEKLLTAKDRKDLLARLDSRGL